MKHHPASPGELLLLSGALYGLLALGCAGSPPVPSEPPLHAMEASAPIRRLRARALGLSFGELPPGPHNGITDVAGVRVGHLTVRSDLGACTGITAILPHGDNPVLRKVACGLSVANGFGKLVGATQVLELGELESPILLTSTLNVFRVADGVLDHLLEHGVPVEGGRIPAYA